MNIPFQILSNPSFRDHSTIHHRIFPVALLPTVVHDLHILEVL